MPRPWLAALCAGGALLRACGGGGDAVQDARPECAEWAKRGDCDANPGLMLKSCRRSCRRALAQKERRARRAQEHQLAVGRMRACAGVAEPTDGAVQEAEGSCRQRCGQHEDCLGQCERLAPRELHVLLRRCAPWPLLSSVAVSPGLHVVCLVPSESCEDVGSHAVVFRGGRVADRPQVHSVPRNVTTLSAFTKHFEDHVVLKRRRGELYQGSGFFTTGGERLLRLSSLLKEPTLLMFEGGQWVWPTVRLGHVTELPGLRSPGEVARITTVSLAPAVFEIDSFLLPAESEHMMRRVSHAIGPSEVRPIDKTDTTEANAAKEYRTSSQEFLPTSGDDVLAKVEARVQTLTRIPITHAEHIQVLRYNRMEHYGAHHDFFDPAVYASNSDVMGMIQNGAMNRMATVFFYLTNVTRGGETNFPMAGGLPQPRDVFDCSRGYSSWPAANKVIVFYSMLPNGSMDGSALHGGCDVLEGQKWSANFWLWNKPVPRNRHHAERRKTASLIGAVGDPGNKEVKYVEKSPGRPEL